MTFDEIEKRWKSAKTLGLQRRLWEDLTGPDRGWFTACRHAVSMRDNCTLQSWLSPHDSGEHALVSAYGTHVANTPDIANTLRQEAIDLLQVHLRCALVVLKALAVVKHDHWPSVPKAVLQLQLQSVAKQTRLPLGFLQDLAHELHCGELRPSARQQVLTVLFADKAQPEPSGVDAMLALEVMQNGTGALYPVPAQAFACWDWQFRQATQHARCYMQRMGLWQDSWDVRWHIQLPSAQTGTPLSGPSLGAAFALGLAKLMAERQETPEAARLHALDLAQVTITATIDASGCLGGIGYLGEKHLAAAQKAGTRGLLRLLIVAADQPDIPPVLLHPEASPLRIIPAATLKDAIDKLYEEHSPRAAVRRYERRECAMIDLLDRRVPIEVHYQVLPLLQEVKPEQLPRASRSPDAEDERHTMEIIRWEEEMRGEHMTYTRHTLEEVFTNFQRVVKHTRSPVPRLVVLGPPGSGKTTLTQYLAWWATDATQRFFGKPLVPARVRLREWEAWACQDHRRNFSLPDYLAECYRQRSITPAPTTAQWHYWLVRGEGWLLLDGLDETRGDKTFGEALRTTLIHYNTCPTVLTCRTVSFAQYTTLCPDMPVFTLAGLDKQQRNAYIHAYPARPSERFDARALIAQLDRTSQMHPLAANPLLLSIICFVVAHGIALPATRGELYDKATDTLLLLPQRIPVTYKPALLLTRKRRILERAALALFADIETRTTATFDEDRLLGALTVGAKAEKRAAIVDSLLIDLVSNSGIMRGSAREGYFFLHLTLQEFLAGSCLARLVNTSQRKGWNTRLEYSNRRWTVQQLVDEKAWNPRWQEVITLLAGRLDDPLPLLDLLRDSTHDDLFRHRLCLAARCLPELTLQRQQHLSHAYENRAHQVAQGVFNFWWEYKGHGVGFTHITQCLPSLANSGSVFRLILEYLRAMSASVRLRAIEALREMGVAAAHHPAVLPALVEVVQQATNGKVRASAIEVLGQMGAAAAHHPVVLPTLVEAVLRATDWEVCWKAIEALGRIGAAAAHHPVVLPALVEAVQQATDWKVRWNAIEALGRIGAAAAHHPVVLPTLVEAVLRATDEVVRRKAIEALGRIGAAAAHHPVVLPTLVEAILRATDEEVRWKAIEALGRIGAAAAHHPVVLPALVEAALWATDKVVRWKAIEALREMDAAAAHHPAVLPALVEVALRATDEVVRWKAIEALREMDAAAAHHPAVLPALVEAVQPATDWKVRTSAVKVLGWMGAAAAHHPAVLPTLVEAVQPATDWRVRSIAIEALGRIGAAAAHHPAVLPTLVEVALRATDWWVIRWKAIEALGRIGAAVAHHPAVLSALVEVALRATDEELLRTSSIEALGQMGAAAAHHPAVLPTLVEAVQPATAEAVRASAVKVLGQMGAAAAHHPAVLPALVEAVRHARFVPLREGAVKTLGQMGAVAAHHPEILLLLVDVVLLNITKNGFRIMSENESVIASEVLVQMGEATAHHPTVLPALVEAVQQATDWEVRTSASRTLERLMLQGVRIFQTKHGDLGWKNVYKVAPLDNRSYHLGTGQHAWSVQRKR